MSKVNNLDLRDLIHSHGRTIRQAGVSHTHFIDLANGRAEAGPNAISKIAAALGVTATVVHAACRESCRRASASKRASRGKG